MGSGRSGLYPSFHENERTGNGLPDPCKYFKRAN